MALTTIEEVRKLFFDPNHTERNQDHIALIDAVVQMMGEIYAAKGNRDSLSDDAQEWLDSRTQTDDEEASLHSVSAKILEAELKTRLFDEKFVGQIHGQGSAIGIIGQMVGLYMNTNTIVPEVSKSENVMEQEVVRTFAKWFGYDTQATEVGVVPSTTVEYNKLSYGGNVITDGTLANIQSMWIAREKAQRKLPGSARKHANFYVLGSEMAHYSVHKACEVLGMSLITVPSKDFKTDVSAIRDIIDQIQAHQPRRDGGTNVIVAMVGLAGETETGMVDDLEELAKIAAEYNIHLHVDAAYGGPYILSEAGHLFKGIEKSDSISVDPHKMLYQPYEGAVLLCKNKADLKLIQQRPRYLTGQQETIKPEDNHPEFGMSRVEGSLGAGKVIAAWATMQLFKEEGLGTLLDYTINMTRYLHSRINQSSILYPLHDPETNTLLVGTHIPNPNGETRQKSLDAYNRILKQVTNTMDNRGYYVSRNGRVDNGRTALRFVVCNPFTTEAVLDEIVDALEEELTAAFGLD
jgi:glutamate/tyrosine decarboxylase-like PLP-dependent enzyme